jgi:hypothetical protein
MKSQSERISLQGYIYEKDLKRAVEKLRKSYKDSELVREGLRCLARREGLMPLDSFVEENAILNEKSAEMIRNVLEI